MTITADTTVTASGLPVEFVDLEPFAAWILATEGERYGRRLTAPMEEMQAFYDAAFPRLPAIIEHCNQHPLGDLPDEVHNLMLLTYSLIQVSFAVEVWRQGRVPDSGAAAIECTREPRI